MIITFAYGAETSGLAHFAVLCIILLVLFENLTRDFIYNSLMCHVTTNFFFGHSKVSQHFDCMTAHFSAIFI